MSAEEEETDVAGETPAPADRSKITPAGKKPALAKKRAVAKKPAAAKGPGAEPEDTAAATNEPVPAKEVAATKKPAAESKAARSASAKPSRRRVVRARARYVRTSARKARMVSGHLRGKTVSEARAILAFTPREVARDWSKLLESAVTTPRTTTNCSRTISSCGRHTPTRDQRSSAFARARWGARPRFTSARAT